MKLLAMSVLGNYMLAAALIVLGLFVRSLLREQKTRRREAFIRSYEFPNGVFSELSRRHPHLSQKDLDLVSRGLRQFFLAYLSSGRLYVSMPSQVVDDLWHAFILHTRHYELFCLEAFGQLLHHTPAVALSDQRGREKSNEGLRRCWKQACLEENINPSHPLRMPLLFSLDRKLGIEGGFEYVPDCLALRSKEAQSGAVHCGGDFTSASFDGGTAGMSDTAGGGHHGADGDGGHGDGGGHGGGDGGGGDGGGCGGGD